MNYLMLVCGEDAPVPADAKTDGVLDIDSWIALCGDRRIYGDALDAPTSARTVRRRDGQTLVSDGPFIEAKEFIGGFDLLSCEDLDAAIAIAAAHPMAASRMIELRPFPADFAFDDAGERLLAAESAPGQRFMMMASVNGIPETDAVETQIMRDADAWATQLTTAGQLVFGHALQGPDTATTVRARAGATVLSDGPFVETKEFLAGFCVLRCADLDEAVALSARFPLAAYHPVEVRPFMVWEDAEAQVAS